ncbi:transposase [Bradyrhizobium sp. TZ2]
MMASQPMCRCRRATGNPRRRAASASRILATILPPMLTVARPANCCVQCRGRWENTSGRSEIRYASSTKTCRTCPLRARCLSPKASRRTIGRWEHEDVLDRHRARMQGADELMRRRSGIVEHPFGTLKCRAGYRHFLVRGFNKVRGEWNLMALCYNFTRVLNILGFERFVACVAKVLLSRQRASGAAMDDLQLALERFLAYLTPWFALRRCRQASFG